MESRLKAAALSPLSGLADLSRGIDFTAGLHGEGWVSIRTAKNAILVSTGSTGEGRDQREAD
jgi:hypothetical protein